MYPIIRTPLQYNHIRMIVTNNMSITPIDMESLTQCHTNPSFHLQVSNLAYSICCCVTAGLQSQEPTFPEVRDYPHPTTIKGGAMPPRSRASWQVMSQGTFVSSAPGSSPHTWDTGG